MPENPALTRRRLNERFESWGIFYGEVQVGGLSQHIGVGSTMIWQWSCGFYPGCDRRTQMSAGNALTFEEAKAEFQKSWVRLQPQITPAMIDEWRQQRAFTAWKYAMIDAGCQLPTQSTTGRARCYCGNEVTIAGMPEHVHEQHMGTKEIA
jgi:hypothetical protein